MECLLGELHLFSVVSTIAIVNSYYDYYLRRNHKNSDPCEGTIVTTVVIVSISIIMMIIAYGKNNSDPWGRNINVTIAIASIFIRMILIYGTKQ